MKKKIRKHILYEIKETTFTELDDFKPIFPRDDTAYYAMIRYFDGECIRTIFSLPDKFDTMSGADRWIADKLKEWEDESKDN